ncbi:hypothetical protein GCM10023175_12730 [Pseudonocardia xishanensis]|uniref:UPF0434 protein GCM10023175_12730 n=1 Tax=Pseudonocardia xishanensis TaxID=630995 RepID=A0ABP8RK72_9PSEU
MPAPLLDPRLLEILACPAEDHAPLRETADGLVCSSCGRRYPIVDGIPVLLVSEAEPTVGTEAEPTVGTEAEPAEPTVGTEAEPAEPTVGTEAEPTHVEPDPGDPGRVG